MKMKDRYFVRSATLVLCLVSLLAGCRLQPQPWYMTAHKEGDAVQFCLAMESTCPQKGGISVSGISVYRYDSTAENELVWDAEPGSPFADQKISGVVTYGIPPKNWHNKLTPPPLVCGKAYLVNPGAIYFGLKCDGTVVVFDSPHLWEFFKDAPPAQPKSGDGP